MSAALDGTIVAELQAQVDALRARLAALEGDLARERAARERAEARGDHLAQAQLSETQKIRELLEGRERGAVVPARGKQGEIEDIARELALPKGRVMDRGICSVWNRRHPDQQIKTARWEMRRARGFESAKPEKGWRLLEGDKVTK